VSTILDRLAVWIDTAEIAYEDRYGALEDETDGLSWIDDPEAEAEEAFAEEFGDDADDRERE